mmetsp:Transcript_13304/g.20259  ORF Transcript_13304/g.20259 Transcript_13304/m.20259 type:complete len:301 (+) Transcript_13304:167-1069(+)|eukprot:CAMPEP_0178906372 /NCGR_PEP_ID=MMETSP0786-20121207/6790_1 /TAXON_ID=186022 /ORGANISM="Thalassionema frauenfeldii, Strain CCMP 1798" /LENGTH=300 /DNA_ID=CAMNT_0020578075 /DNA_START=102 /DNA_END=1004 /DNA_ORIENTATION=-
MSSGAVPSGLSEQTLLLDSDIRDWVVLPLLMIMISAGLLRHFVGLLLKPDPKPLTKIESRAKNDMARAVRLRSGNANFISQERWESRRRYFADKESGYLREESEWATKETEKQKEEGAAPGEIDPMNPMSMMDGMKGSMVFMVQNMVMMQGISHFFQGFILLKVPFPLTRGFKMMFQRGLGEFTSNLDTSYVSSVSWYFLVMFGLRGFFRMVIGDPSQEQMESNQMQMSLGLTQSAGPKQFDAPKALLVEADNLELLFRPKSELDEVERRLLGSKYPKKKIQAKDDLYGYGTISKSKKKA